MKCPNCRHASHTRTSRYITQTIKEIYYQCQNVNCSATFKATESFDHWISEPQVSYAKTAKAA